MPTYRGFAEGADLDVRFELGLIDDHELASLHADRVADLQATSAQLRDAGWSAVDARDDVDESFRALLRSLAATDAPIVLANLEDLWGETEQQNVPGTTSEQPNWRRVTRRPVDELDHDTDIDGTAAAARRVRPA